MRARTGSGGPRLRPYQSEPLRAIARSVQQGWGLTFTVLMSRQAGKNELSAYLEMLLLARSAVAGGTIVKCAPTFRPQVLNSLDRLARRLDAAGFGGYWRREHGYGIRLGNARALFFSAAPGGAGRRPNSGLPPRSGRGAGCRSGEVREGFPADGRDGERDDGTLRHALG